MTRRSGSVKWTRPARRARPTKAGGRAPREPTTAGRGYTPGMKSWLSPDVRAVLLALVIAPACTGEKYGGTDSGGSSTGASSSSSGEASTVTTTGGVFTSTVGQTGDTSTGEPDSSSGTTGEQPIMCGGEDPYFPPIDRSCTTNRDCAIVFHQIDCCGSLLAWGINGAVAKAFGEAEAMCAEQYQECECAPMSTVADDGKIVDDVNLVAVACTDGECQSYVP